MNIFTRTLIFTFPLVCAAGALAAPVAAHPGDRVPITPVCSGGGAVSPTTPPERHGAAGPTVHAREGAVPAVPARDGAFPAPVPVRVTVHDLTGAPPSARGEAGRPAAPVEVEIVVRGGGSGSAAELPALLRDLVRTLATPQRMPAPRPHR
ncbi:hypothetical protein ACFU44_30310 [Nocardia rhizosphaerihabitans]|uniref:hypothetical protein n=1 Tax=Nocardia rhizosphaerihabitans TaxID=1691570 RepID=UPI003670327F